MHTENPSVYQRLTPNIYTIGDFPKEDIDSELFIGVLDFPGKKNEEVNYEDRVFSFYKYETDSKGDKVLPSSTDAQNPRVVKYFINVKVPSDVDEFYLNVYDYYATTLTCYNPDEDPILYRYKIKLNK